MPNHARNHEESRKVVCLLCFNKTKLMRNISKNANVIINEHFISGYDSRDVRFPSVLCSNCYTIVCEYGRKDFTHHINLYDHSLLADDKAARTTTNIQCECKICLFARASTSANISQSSITLQKKKPGLSSTNPSNTKEVLKICSICFSNLKRGQQHICSNRKRHLNLLDIAPDDSVKEKICSTFIRDKVANSTSPSSSLSLACNNGRSISILTTPPPIRRQMSSDDLHKIQTDMNLSSNQTKTLSKYIRSAMSDRNAIEPYSRNILLMKNHRLDNCFKVQNQAFWISDRLVDHPVVYCCSPRDIWRIIQEERNFDCDEHVRSTIGIDGGGEFLKICLTVQKLNSNLLQENRRSKYIDGVGEKQFKESSVKKLFIIAIVKDVPENYRNVLALWNLLELTSLTHPFAPFFCAMDLKLANIMLGLMSHSSNHPCCWCDIQKDKLNEKGKLRTLGSIRTLYWAFLDSKKDISKAKNYGNVIHMPVFKNPDDISVLQVIPPPELHLLLGAVNSLFNDLLKIWPEAIKWADSIHVVREAMHGGSFTGNSCCKLLNNVSKLESLAPQFGSHIAAFHSLKQVVDSCFGQKLEPLYVQKICQFKEDVERLGIQVTPKLHAIFYHVEDFCKEINAGLGCYSEQSFESVHSDFAKTWMKYKVTTSHQYFSKQLLRAVQEYNSRHL